MNVLAMGLIVLLLVYLLPMLGMEVGVGAEGFCKYRKGDGECPSPPDYAKKECEGRGRYEVYRYPHYYGMGPGFGYHYGSPYYKRFVEFPYPGTKGNCKGTGY